MVIGFSPFHEDDGLFDDAAFGFDVPGNHDAEAAASRGLVLRAGGAEAFWGSGCRAVGTGGDPAVVLESQLGAEADVNEDAVSGGDFHRLQAGAFGFWVAERLGGAGGDDAPLFVVGPLGLLRLPDATGGLLRERQRLDQHQARRESFDLHEMIAAGLELNKQFTIQSAPRLEEQGDY